MYDSAIDILFIFLMILIFFMLLSIIFNSKKSKKEGFNPPTDSGFNACGSPCSVLPPQWIGRADQGNGLLGDDHLSGFNFYKAY